MRSSAAAFRRGGGPTQYAFPYFTGLQYRVSTAVELGVSEAKEIDLLAIADCVGAQVLYRRLVGCEAQIVGFKNRAIIYVSDGARPNRKRFSTGHELGH